MDAKSRDSSILLLSAMASTMSLLQRIADSMRAHRKALRISVDDFRTDFASTIALILSQLDPVQAAGILAQLPERMQSDVAYRIATMENITPAVLKEIEEALEASLRDLLGGDQDVGGPKVVADILNLTGSSTEKNVLDLMDAGECLGIFARGKMRAEAASPVASVEQDGVGQHHAACGSLELHAMVSHVGLVIREDRVR